MEKSDSENYIFWPDNGYSLSFGLLLSVGVYGIWFHQMERVSFLSLPSFILIILIIFFYRQRIVIKNGIVSGPSAYGNLRRTKIKFGQVETFYNKRKLGFSYIVIRDQFSSRQIFAFTSLFSPETLEKLHVYFPEKKKIPVD